MAQDHKFKVSNGTVREEFESFREAADYQYEQNTANVAVGYEPNYKMWLVDSDGIECIVQTQV